MGAHPGQARPGEWLRQQRVAAGLTQEDLAERSGVSVRAIADLERGRTRQPVPVLGAGAGARARAAGHRRVRSWSRGTGPRAARRAAPSTDGDGPQHGDAARRRRGDRAAAAADAGAALRGAGRGARAARRRARRGGRPTGAAGATGVVISAIGGTAGSARPRSRCTGRTGSRTGSPTGSSTRTCAGSTPRTAGPPIPPTCCAGSSTRSACTRSGCRPTSRGWPRCTGRCSPGGGCSCCSTTPPTSPRCGRCCPPRPSAWSS